MALLDAEGLDALSMRRLGGRLNAGATSLYWHVATKDELLELVLDEVYGEFRAHDSEHGGWREVMLGFAYAMRDSLIRHAWAIPLIGTRPAIGPQALRVMSRLTNTFDQAGFEGFDTEYATAVVLSYVLGAVAPEAAWKTMTVRGGGDAQAVRAAMRPLLAEAAAGHPDLLARFDSYEHEDPAVLRALSFDFGLGCVLDGLAARLDRQATGSRPSSARPAGKESPAS